MFESQTDVPSMLKIHYMQIPLRNNECNEASLFNGAKGKKPDGFLNCSPLLCNDLNWNLSTQIVVAYICFASLVAIVVKLR